MLSPFRVQSEATRTERRSLPRRWTVAVARRWLFDWHQDVRVELQWAQEVPAKLLERDTGPKPEAAWYRVIADS